MGLYLYVRREEEDGADKGRKGKGGGGQRPEKEEREGERCVVAEEEFLVSPPPLSLARFIPRGLFFSRSNWPGTALAFFTSSRHSSKKLFFVSQIS